MVVGDFSFLQSLTWWIFNRDLCRFQAAGQAPRGEVNVKNSQHGKLRGLLPSQWKPRLEICTALLEDYEGDNHRNHKTPPVIPYFLQVALRGVGLLRFP